jgi:cell division septation protein DedD
MQDQNTREFAYSCASIAAIVLFAALSHGGRQPEAVALTAPLSAASIPAIEAEAADPAYSDSSQLLSEGTDTTQPAPAPAPKPDETTFAANGVAEHPPPSGTAVGDWHINLAALTRQEEARELVDKLRHKGLNAAHRTAMVNGTRIWRVYLQGYPTRIAAQQYASQLDQHLGLHDYWISKS